MWKRGFILCFVLGFGILSAAGIPSRESDVSGKMISYRAVRIIAAPRNQVAEFAAEEAYQLLTRAGLKAEKGKGAAAGKLNLVLGKHPDFPFSQQSLDGVPDGGFRIIKDADILCIHGDDTPGRGPFRDTSAMSYGYSKGTLYGLYEFLERYAGIRFYFPGKQGTIVPKKPLALPEKIKILDYPEWEERSYLPWFKTGGTWPSSVQEYPKNPNLVLLNTLRLRANTISTNLSNALQTGNYLNRFWKTHPEYFAMTKDGRRVPEVRQKDFRCQFCLHSGIEEEIYQDIKAYFEGKSAPFSLNRPQAFRNASSKRLSRWADVQIWKRGSTSAIWNSCRIRCWQKAWIVQTSMTGSFRADRSRFRIFSFISAAAALVKVITRNE